MNLKTPLSKVLRTTKDHIDALESMKLFTVEDLLLYLPRAHDDLTQMDTITTAPLNEKVSIRGTVIDLKMVYTRTKKKLVTGRLVDTDGGVCEVIWFNQPHVKRMLTDGDQIVLTGKLVENGRKLQMQSPTFELDGTSGSNLIHAGRLVPIYPQHDIINTKWLREKIVLIKDAISDLRETFPAEVLEQENLIGRADAIRALHFPENGEEVRKAYERLAFEEMVEVQKEAIIQKKEWQGEEEERLSTPMNVELIKAFFESLKFTPTDSQKVAIYEILKDMEKPRPMSRLLEGDVGSGKTLVATAVIANTLTNGGQCALMVPTEVLAKQHMISISKVLINFHNFLKEEGLEASIPLPTVKLLTGSVPVGEGNQIKQSLCSGTVDLIIGTHALITENVRFKDLRLVIVDEQHRFGVRQREMLREKGNPHFLSMTATPIPRTLALTAYGHHDLSVLLEKPGNRKPIHTKVVSPRDRRTVEGFIDQQIGEKRQVFVICPLIKESESEEMAEIRSVENEKKRLEEGFPHRKIALLHGKMTPQEKEETMNDFKDRKADILVSTSVIEVGIDIPNASIIIIEGSERFGLSQLHQFRGRVGRGEHKSHCFLFTTTEEQASSPRLKAMEDHDSGFLLAEIDLQIRGPGELFGTRQSGIPEEHLTKYVNPEMVVRARRVAEMIENERV